MRLYQLGTAPALGISWDPRVAYTELPDGAYIGQKLYSADGEDAWRVCRAGGTITKPGGAGELCQINVVSTGSRRTSLTLTSAQLEDVNAGDRSIDVTVALQDGLYGGGWLVHNGVMYKVAGNTTNQIILRDPISESIGSADGASLFTNPYQNVVASGATVAKVAGVSEVLPVGGTHLANGQYFLAKIKGLAVLAMGAIVATSGRISPAANGGGDDNLGTEIIGQIANANTALGAANRPLMLNIA